MAVCFGRGVGAAQIDVKPGDLVRLERTDRETPGSKADRPDDGWTVLAELK